MIGLETDSQDWFWTSEWQKGEHEADEDLAKGYSITFETEEEFDEYLNKLGTNND